MATVLASTDQFPLPLNLTVYQGATFTKTFTWTTGPDRSNQTPVDLTGYTAEMAIRSGQTVVISLTTGNSGIALGTTDGRITLNIDASDTATLTAANAEYDLLLASGGVVTPLLGGW
ncbi:hypothetical protein [Gemmata obscuriglobus]|uniref:hypothetical protein n=1 Tax=Gemmata obscuriglobus TaxID=114 RepID=UPI00137BA244|nr:hypothetical protein [Gemmata obscuriglobus]VTS03577.1 Uncharacterized protein OS=Comamonas testosteroni GN=P245_14400 PE=4 SV=1 [Gemmata obscuriglobus UQM 2246]